MDAKKIKRYMTEVITEEDLKDKMQLDLDLETDVMSGYLTMEEADFLREAYDIN